MSILKSASGTCGESCHKELNRINQGKGCQSVRRIPGDKIAVSDIVDGLNQERKHDG